MMFKKEYFIKWNIGEQSGNGVYWIRPWENFGDILDGIARCQKVRVSDISIIECRRI
mgnify:CR=1 FL=1